MNRDVRALAFAIRHPAPTGENHSSTGEAGNRAGGSGASGRVRCLIFDIPCWWSRPDAGIRSIVSGGRPP
jgi:hypothetical protein